MVDNINGPSGVNECGKNRASVFKCFHPSSDC